MSVGLPPSPHCVPHSSASGDETAAYQAASSSALTATSKIEGNCQRRQGLNRNASFVSYLGMFALVRRRYLGAATGTAGWPDYGAHCWILLRLRRGTGAITCAVKAARGIPRRGGQALTTAPGRT